jgi:hypothetical protein
VSSPSLKIHVVATAVNFLLEADVPVCPRLSGDFDGVTNAAGTTLSAWYYLQSAVPMSGTLQGSMYVGLAGGGVTTATVPSANPSQMPVNTWFQVSGQILPVVAPSLSQIGLFGVFNQEWDGYLYADNFTVQ